MRGFEISLEGKLWTEKRTLSTRNSVVERFDILKRKQMQTPSALLKNIAGVKVHFVPGKFLLASSKSLKINFELYGRGFWLSKLSDNQFKF
jgi:hypothetical protein